jgi:phenylalanyl-tRNA synthetase alpha chain
VDARHHHTFHQLELLSVGEDVTIADFKGVIETLFSELFGKDVKARLRPHYFPFTEPSFEADLTCIFCDDGCRVCKGTGWIEIGGAGMVHPLVLEKMNVDSQRYQGFALGYGIERMAMLKYGINDVRVFLDNDLRFLRQF